jgi:transient receptor potential cation channel subfamily V protein 5
MIYRMLAGDLLRFVAIYLIFVMGFSQAYYVIFLSFKNGDSENLLGTPAESVVAMFMVSLASFDNMYENFKYTDHELIAKVKSIFFLLEKVFLKYFFLSDALCNIYGNRCNPTNQHAYRHDGKHIH